MLIRYPNCNCYLQRANKLGFVSICRKYPGRPVNSKKSDFTAKDIYVLNSLFIRDTWTLLIKVISRITPPGWTKAGPSGPGYLLY